MDIDQEKVEQTVLALLYLTSFKDKLNSLHEKGFISNPATKAKSVALTEEGAKRSQELFEKRFTLK